MRAIVDINGKQYEVEEGRYLLIDRYSAQENDELTLGNVKMIVAGEQTMVGTPFVDGATVKVAIRRHRKGPKVIVYKMRCKKGYRRKNGYRHDFTELQVVSVDFPGKENITPAKQEPAEEKPKKEPKTQKTATKAKAAVEAPEAPAEEKPKTTRKKSESGKTTKAKAKAEEKPAEEQPVVAEQPAATEESKAPEAQETAPQPDETPPAAKEGEAGETPEDKVE
jgi:large subunit ribosomal protein L21